MTDLNGQPFGSVNVAVIPAASHPLSVMGGTVTDSAGRYTFEIRAIRKGAGSFAAAMYIRGVKYASAGGRATLDSVRVAVQLVPMDVPPPTIAAADVRLPL